MRLQPVRKSQTEPAAVDPPSELFWANAVEFHDFAGCTQGSGYNGSM